jgi:hypothetical protein
VLGPRLDLFGRARPLEFFGGNEQLEEPVQVAWDVLAACTCRLSPSTAGSDSIPSESMVIVAPPAADRSPARTTTATVARPAPAMSRRTLCSSVRSPPVEASISNTPEARHHDRAAARPGRTAWTGRRRRPDLVCDGSGAGWLVADPAALWKAAQDDVAAWTKTNNPFPGLMSQPQRIYGWASLTLASDSLSDAHGFAGDAQMHVDGTRAAVQKC